MFIKDSFVISSSFQRFHSKFHPEFSSRLPSAVSQRWNALTGFNTKRGTQKLPHIVQKIDTNIILIYIELNQFHYICIIYITGYIRLIIILYYEHNNIDYLLISSYGLSMFVLAHHFVVCIQHSNRISSWTKNGLCFYDHSTRFLIDFSN